MSEFYPSDRQLRILSAIQDINSSKTGSYCTVYDLLEEFDEEVNDNRRTNMLHSIAPLVEAGLIEKKIIHYSGRGHPFRGFCLTTKAADFV